MKEKILKIEEVESLPSEDDEYKAYSLLGTRSGFQITTDKQIIQLLIEDEQNCCEDWGYLLSEDNLEEFIGEYITDIYLTDKKLKTINTYKQLDGSTIEFLMGIHEKLDIVFVNVETTKGLLQFAAYNAHNGYYGHKVFINSKQLNYKETL